MDQGKADALASVAIASRKNLDKILDFRPDGACYATPGRGHRRGEGMPPRLPPIYASRGHRRHPDNRKDCGRALLALHMAAGLILNFPYPATVIPKRRDG